MKRDVFKAPEVCEMAQLQPYVLRTWEAEFPALGHAPNGGPRVYRRADVEMVLRIKQLVFVEGLTLAGARRRAIRGRCCGRRRAWRDGALAAASGAERARSDHEVAREGCRAARTATCAATNREAAPGHEATVEAGGEERERKASSTVVTQFSGRSAARFSAPAWGAGGRWFESSRPDHSSLINPSQTQ
jgi:DNA-binding transcriptional MerR regulator